MEKSARAAELAVDRWEEHTPEEVDREQAGLEIFRLSGGVLAPATRTSNRIDGLLGRMLVQQGSAMYLGDIDKNLDFLFTSLQLDLIERVANDVSSRQPEVETEGIEAPLELPEPVISLDRVRTSV